MSNKVYVKNRARGEARFKALFSRVRVADDSYIAGPRKTPSKPKCNHSWVHVDDSDGDWEYCDKCRKARAK